MIHFGVDVTVKPAGAFGEDCQIRRLRVGEQMFANANKGLFPHVKVDGLLFRCLVILFDEVFYKECQYEHISAFVYGITHRSRNLLDSQDEFRCP